MKLLLFLALAVTVHKSNAVDTKMDFGEPPPTYFSEEPTFKVSNSSVSVAKPEDGGTKNDEDVELEHTIVVTTKLKNNNKRGFTSNGDPDGTLTYNVGQMKNRNKDDDDEVPVIKSYKSVDTTYVKTPDSRHKTKIYPDSIFVSRNIRDEGDVFPNVAVYPLNWKPAGFYNNINYQNQDNMRDPYSMSRRRPNQGYINRKISEEGQREFYCKKCAELSNAQGYRVCGMQSRSANAPNFNQNQNAGFKPNVPNFQPIYKYETTTQKIKIDGKLAKLN